MDCEMRLAGTDVLHVLDRDHRASRACSNWPGSGAASIERGAAGEEGYSF